MYEEMLVTIISGQKVELKDGTIQMFFHIFKEWKQAMEEILNLEGNLAH